MLLPLQSFWCTKHLPLIFSYILKYMYLSKVQSVLDFAYIWQWIKTGVIIWHHNLVTLFSDLSSHPLHWWSLFFFFSHFCSFLLSFFLLYIIFWQRVVPEMSFILHFPGPTRLFQVSFPHLFNWSCGHFSREGLKRGSHSLLPALKHSKPPHSRFATDTFQTTFF